MLLMVSASCNCRQWAALSKQAAQFSDLESFHVDNSTLHGRGVLASRPLAKGRLHFLQFFEVLEETALPQSRLHLLLDSDKLSFKQGFIPEGSDLATKHNVPVEVALAECSADTNCVGVTFQPPNDGKPPAFVVYKGKGNVVSHSDWHSYIKRSKASSPVYYPLGCNSHLLSLDQKDSSPSRGLAACGARLVNHHCEPSCEMAVEQMGADFAIPGMPWTKGLVRARYLHALRELQKGEELTVDYNQIPFVMSTHEKTMFRCPDEPNVSQLGVRAEEL